MASTTNTPVKQPAPVNKPDETKTPSEETENDELNTDLNPTESQQKTEKGKVSTPNPRK